MAVIAIAGGRGNVGPHVIDALVARKKHRLIILSRKRKQPAEGSLPAGIAEHKVVDYSSHESLRSALQGVDVVLSFILPFADKDNVAQKNLIDASIQANVKRFAPSEWSVSSNSTNPFYNMRDEVRRYLEQVNAATPKIEYTCFQPGLFLDYLTYPQQSTKYLKITQHYIDFDSRNALVPESGDQPTTFTLVDDMAQVVAEAIDYTGPWPADGGIAGWTTTTNELVAIGERLRGGQEFNTYIVHKPDLDAGVLKSDWCPVMEHPAIPKDQLEPMSRRINAQALKGIIEGAWTTSNSWNKHLPDFKFQDPLAYLETWWSTEGKQVIQ